MPSARTLEAGNAVIKLSLQDKVSQGLSKVAAKMKTIGTGFEAIGRAGMVAATAVAAPFVACIKFASDAQETLSRFKQVFGEQTKAAEKFAGTLAKTVGRSAVDIKSGLATFQSFFVGLGFGGERSRQLSEQLQALSIDFASFNNVSDDEALSRFISALSGSSEVVDKYGINLKQAALEQELLSMGVDKSWTAVTEQEKALARLNIITKAMGQQGAVGDAARTMGSFANQVKALQSRAKDAAIELGTALLPAATKIVSAGADAAGRVAEWSKGNADLIATTATSTAKVWLASVAINGLGKVVRAVSLLVGGLKVAIGAVVANPVIAVIAAIAASFIFLGNEIRKTKNQAKEFMAEMKRLRIQQTSGRVDPRNGMVVGSLEHRDWEISNSDAWKEGQAKIAAEQAAKVKSAAFPWSNAPASLRGMEAPGGRVASTFRITHRASQCD